ncbi:MAG: VOC family protein [Nitrococcus mobilis]|nr:VOC family protein [Nitrococcus mobilis]
MQKITPFLWFDGDAEEAAQFYVSVFPSSRISRVLRYGNVGEERHRQPPGTVMTVAFELDGQAFTALNGGPVFEFNQAISFVVDCATQAEVDYYWQRLGEGGDPAAQQCGWLKDRYGLAWQIVPRRLIELLADPDPATADRVMQAMLPMKKLDIAALERAATGPAV